MDRFTYRCLRLIYVTRKWLVQQFTPAGLGVLAGGIGSALVSLGSTRSMCHVLFFFALALLILGTIGSRLIQFRFKATRLLPRFGTVGEPLPYQVVIQNLSPQPQKGLKLVETFATPSLASRSLFRLNVAIPLATNGDPIGDAISPSSSGPLPTFRIYPPSPPKAKPKPEWKFSLCGGVACSSKP